MSEMLIYDKLPSGRRGKTGKLLAWYRQQSSFPGLGRNGEQILGSMGDIGAVRKVLLAGKVVCAIH